MSNFLDLFQGFGVMAASDPVVVAVRIALVILGFVLVWLGRKGVLEPLLMIPMGLGMATINVSSMFFDPINMANKTPWTIPRSTTCFSTRRSATTIT